MDVNSEFWTGRRVFVTGHTGFKGGWLCLWLGSMGAEVTGYSLAPPSTPNFFDAVGLADHMRSLHGDVRDRTDLASAIAASAPEVIFHLAAQSLVRPSYDDPASTYATNVMGTVHLLEAVRQDAGNVRAVVNVTSDKCYENREWPWGYRETDAIGGFDPYSNSKAASELVTAAYRRSFLSTGSTAARNAAVATARAGNVIGGGDWATDRLVPDMIRAFAEHRQIIIRNPHSVRPWQHVLEPLAGYLMLAERLHERPSEFAEAWNFGPAEDDSKSVGFLVERVVRLWGSHATWSLDAAPKVHEANVLRLDCSKARTRLHWTPRWALDEALERTVAWYKAHARGEDMRQFSLRQINEFSLSRSQ